MKWQTRWTLIGLLVLGGYAAVLGGAAIARQNPRFTVTRVVQPDGQVAYYQRYATDAELARRSIALLVALPGLGCFFAGIGWALARAIKLAWNRGNRRLQLTDGAHDG